MDRYMFDVRVREKLESLPNSFAIYQFLDGKVEILLVSMGYCEMMGMASAGEAYQFMNRNLTEYVHPDDVEKIKKQGDLFRNMKQPFDLVFRSRIKESDSYHYIHAQAVQYRESDKYDLEIVFYMDITDIVNGVGDNAIKLEEKEENKFDRLTGLPGMSYFLKLADDGAREIQKKGKNLAMLSFNLTGLKMFNQKFGMEEGNRLLIAFGALLEKHYSKSCCSRFGEDHFYAFSESSGVEFTLYQIFDEIKEINNGRSLPVRVGIFSQSGFADTVSASVACERARTACEIDRKTYESKFVYFTHQMELTAREKDYIINNIDNAIKNGYIKTYYQPKVRSLSQKLCGAEALARWDDPIYGFLSPSTFIPILEDSNLTYKLDRYILQQLAKDLKRAIDQGKNIVPVSFNLSRTDFQMTNPLKELERVAEEYGIERKYFRVEITESTVMENPVLMKKYIERFQKSGFSVVMDDFGSGYSSLAMLREFTFDAIKIDMGFMRNFNDRSKKSLKAIVAMIKNLGMHTVAEGVDNEEQFEFFKSIGCEAIQGYYFGKPAPIETFYAQLEQNNIEIETSEDYDFYQSFGLEDLNVNQPISLQYYNGEKFEMIFCNKAYRSLIAVHGLTKDDVMDRTVNTTKKENNRRYRELAQKAIESKREETLAFSMGDRTYLIAVKVLAGARNHYMFRILLRDITLDVEVGNQLKANRGVGFQISNGELAIWQSFIDNTEIKIFWKDRKRRFVGANKSFLAYYGYKTLDEIVGKTDDELWLDQGEYSHVLEETRVLCGEVIKDEENLTLVNGVPKKIHMTQFPICRDDKIIGLLGYFVDDQIDLLSGSQELIANIRKKVVGATDSFLSYEEANEVCQRLPVEYAVLRTIMDDENKKVIDAQYVYANNSFCHCAKMSLPELIGKTIRQLFTSNIEEMLLSAELAVKKGRKSEGSLFVEDENMWVGYTVSPVSLPGYYIVVNTYYKVEILEKLLYTKNRSTDDVVIRIVKILNAEVSLDQLLNQVLKTIGQVIRADRLYVLQYTMDGTKQVYEWMKRGIKSSKEMLKDFEPDQYHMWIEEITYHGMVHIEDVEELKDNEPLLYKGLKEQGIQRLYMVPLYAGGRLLGYLGIDNYEQTTIIDIKKFLDAISYFIAAKINSHLLIEENVNIYEENESVKRSWATENISIRMAKILSNKGESYEQSMKRVLAELGKIIEADRLYILETDTQIIRNSFEWCAEGIQPAIDLLKDVDYQSYMNSREEMLGYDVDDKMEIPFYNCGKLIGFLGAENYKKKDAFNIKSLLETVSYFVGSKVTEYNDLQVIHKAKAQLRKTEIRLQNNLAKIVELDKAKKEQLHVLLSMAQTYYCIYLLNLEEDVIEEYACDSDLRKYYAETSGIQEQMNMVMYNTIASEHLDAILKFVDLSTLPERMEGKQRVSGEFVGMRVGWFIASFIRIESKEDGTPSIVLFTVQVIDEQKRKEEMLIAKSLTDEMTGFYNRYAYEEDLNFYRKTPPEANFAFVSLDINRLKYVNDTMGHSAGDELIVGAAKCMRESLGKYGKVYRIGGDEFVAIIHTNADERENVFTLFASKVAHWKGKSVDGLSISYGIVIGEEIKEMSIDEVTKLADKRMYMFKSNYYKESGLDRRKG